MRYKYTVFGEYSNTNETRELCVEAQSKEHAIDVAKRKGVIPREIKWGDHRSKVLTQFKVCGIDSGTGEEVGCFIEADSELHALKRAKERGVLVSEIRIDKSESAASILYSLKDAGVLLGTLFFFIFAVIITIKVLFFSSQDNHTYDRDEGRVIGDVVAECEFIWSSRQPGFESEYRAMVLEYVDGKVTNPEDNAATRAYVKLYVLD